ncbi:MAG: prolipoprotein diacylglyceryl transferase [Candidatus Limivivens sp.]|nr:prolipoprotein diacylglyceryl transferase [Candidatus Limivivens sp.]
MYDQIRFPHLGIVLEHVGKNVEIFGISIAYYGIIIAAAMLAGIMICTRLAKKAGLDEDSFFNLAIVGIILSVIGARLYYVIFSWEEYRDNLLDIFNIREGGLAIYGGVLTALVIMAVYSRRKKISMGLLGDIVCVGIILGQILGRWGNFFNREAFGGYTDSLLAMQIPLNAVRMSDLTPDILEHLVTADGIEFIQVHPTFLYESLWNLGVLILMLLVTKRKKFNGQVFMIYLGGYGLGRLWIEGLRTDQLLLPVIGWPVSQVLAGVMAAAAAVIYMVLRKKNRDSVMEP